VRIYNLRAFQPSLEYPLLDEKTLVCYHGSPRPYKERILPTTPEEELEQTLAGTQGDLLVGGHTHVQMFRRFKDLLVFNSGSVGLAMDRVSPLSEIRQPAFAEYAIVEYDKTALQVELHRIAFDLQAFIQVMHASGMPHAAWWASHWKEAEKWPFLRAMLGFPRLSKKRARQRATSLGMGCGTHHILSVVEYGKQLAAILDDDADIVEIAALLHDYASIKDSAMYEDHHLHRPREAEVLLQELSYPRATILAVKECSASHRGSQGTQQRTKEAICLASADAMAHIAQLPSLLYLAYVQHQMTIDEGSTWVRDKVQRSWNKLCPEAREIMQEQYESALTVLP
jgi:hypothetical protein